MDIRGVLARAARHARHGYEARVVERRISGWPAVPERPEVIRPWQNGTPMTAGAGVLLVTEALDVGGMDEVVVDLAMALAAHGDLLAVVHAPEDPTERPGRAGERLAAVGVPVEVWHASDMEAGLRRLKPRVLSVHGAPDWVVRTAHRSAIPVVEVVHGGFDLFEGPRPELTARDGSLALVVAVSELVAEQYRRACPGRDAKSLRVVPNGARRPEPSTEARDAVRPALGISQEDVVLVSLARHCLSKNSIALVRAFDVVAADRPSAHLVIAGRADDLTYARRLIRAVDQCAARDRIHLRQHHPDPSALLAAADAFALGTFFEGWSLASMEALMSGLPVVLPEVGGAREQLGAGDAPTPCVTMGGHLVTNPLGNPMDVSWPRMRALRDRRQSNEEELVAALAEVIDNRHEWAVSQEARRDCAVQRFSVTRAMEAHREILKSVTAGPGDRSLR